MLKKLKVVLKIDRGLALVWESSRRWAIFGLVVMLLLGVLPVASLYLHKLIIDLITESVMGSRSGGLSFLVGIIVALAAIEIVVAFLRSLSSYITLSQEHLVQDHVLHTLHGKSTSLDLAYYENPAYHDSLHLAQEEAPARTSKLVQVLGVILQNGLSLLAVMIFLMTYHWGVALLLVVAVVPGLVVHLRSSDRIFAWKKSAASREREAGYYHWLVTTPTPAKEMRVFGFGRVFSEWARK